MQPTPTTRGRHALRWVLGVGLGFVVVVAMALQMARRRADERWVRVVAHFKEAWPRSGAVEGWAGSTAALTFAEEEMGGDSLFGGWRQVVWRGAFFNLVLLQDRNLFASTIEVEMILDNGSQSIRVDVVRGIFTDVDVKFTHSDAQKPVVSSKRLVRRK